MAMASSMSDNRFVMGYPSMNNDGNKYSQAPPPVPGYVLQGAYPPPPPPQPPYFGYPGAPTESKKHVSPSFNVWYNSRNYAPSGWALPEDDSSKRFGRVMLVTMVTLIVSMCMVSLVIWFLFGTQMPEFDVSSLAVSNLNGNDSVITANWDVNITVFKPDTDLRVDFDSVKASIFYKNYPLAAAAVEPFYSHGNRLLIIQIRMDNATAPGKPFLAGEIIENKNGGMMFVSVRLRMEAKFESGSVWRKETLRVFCEDLKINFSPAGGNGTLAEDSQTQCLIFT
nr:uncharacterized protein LOC113692532 [Coffea arabica]